MIASRLPTAGPRIQARAAALVLVAAASAALLRAPASEALPLFSPSTGEACADCHASGVRLNARGMAYLRGAFHSEAAGASHRAEVPLSVTGDLSVARTPASPGLGNAAPLRASPFARRAADVEIESAGALGRRVSFECRDSLAGSLDDSRLAAAWLRYDVANAGRLSVRAGRFPVEFPWLSITRRGTEAEWLSPVGFTARGFELGGSRAAWTWGAGLIASDRAQPHSFMRRQGLFGLEDKLFWITRDGATASSGVRVRFGHQDSDLIQHAWLQRIQAEASSMADFGRTRLVGAYTFDRFDDRPAAGIHERYQYGLLEAVETLDRDRRWTLSARLDHEVRTRTVLTPEEDRQIEVLALGDRVRPNLGLSLEWAHSGDNVGGPRRNGIDAACRVAY